MIVQNKVQVVAFNTVTGGPEARKSSYGACAFTDTIAMMGATMPFARNEEIYGESESAEYLYKVVSGSVRTYKVLNDGRRQIGAFYMPGDIFGLEANAEHSFSAEAIVDSTVLVIKRSTVTSLAARDSKLAHELWTLVTAELHRAQALIMLLIKSAEERVAGFLLEMANNHTAGNVVELPMSRQDIADYLGLTIETVSRTLTQLKNKNAIELTKSRQIVLRNRMALSRMNS